MNQHFGSECCRLSYWVLLHEDAIVVPLYGLILCKKRHHPKATAFEVIPALQSASERVHFRAYHEQLDDIEC